MAYFCRIMEESDIPDIISFEKKKLDESTLSEVEKSIQSWNAKWREEFLQHYAKTGWSFVCVDEDQKSSQNKIHGYFLGQAILFLDGQMQTLWVEHLSFNSLKTRDELCEIAYKLSREKHFQRVLFPNEPGVVNALASFRHEPWQSNYLVVKTTK